MCTMTILRNGTASSCGTSHDGSVTLVPARGRGVNLAAATCSRHRLLRTFASTAGVSQREPPGRGPRPRQQAAHLGAPARLRASPEEVPGWFPLTHAGTGMPKPLRGFLGVPRRSRSSPGHRVLSRLHVQMRTCPPAGARWPPVATRPPRPETPLKCFFYFYFSM